MTFTFPDGSLGVVDYLANGDKSFPKERVEVFCGGGVAVLDDFRKLELVQDSRRRYVGLFLVSAPVWWLFELLNLRTQNWIYLGVESFSPLGYTLLTTLSFSTVIPAVFGSAELVASTGLLVVASASAISPPPGSCSTCAGGTQTPWPLTCAALRSQTLPYMQLACSRQPARHAVPAALQT